MKISNCRQLGVVMIAAAFLLEAPLHRVLGQGTKERTADRPPVQGEGPRARQPRDEQGELQAWRQRQQPDNPNRVRMAQELMRRVYEQLDLTEEQKARIRQIHQESQQELPAARAKVREARRALEEALYGETFNEAVVTSRTNEVAQAEAELIRAETKSQAQVRQVLTAEQARRFRELQKFVRSLGKPAREPMGRPRDRQFPPQP